MAGLEKPDEGEIVRRSRISFPLGHMGGLVPRLSAMENCRFIARIYDKDPDYLEAFCRWVCGLEEYFDMPVGTYSAGMASRFSFSLLLALDFDFYLIDEGMPATTDAEFNRKAGQILYERLKTSTVIIVSHQATTLEKFCKTAAVLRHGRMLMFDTLEEAKAVYDYQPQSA
jgi:capsular polysaccharide transport system ATP-binding protein